MSMSMQQQETVRSALRNAEHLKASHNQHHCYPTKNNIMMNKSKSKNDAIIYHTQKRNKE
jgi:hypothetical protein